MIVRQFQILLLGCVLSTSAVAGMMGSEELYDDRNSVGVITLSAGPAWTRAGRSQNLYFPPDVVRFTANTKKQRIAAVELFFGYQRILNSRLLGQLGLTLEENSLANLRGTGFDQLMPSNTFSYNYNVRHMHFGLKVKLLTDIRISNDMFPYLSAGVAAARNWAKSYIASSTSGQNFVPPAFNSAGSSAFAYTLGAGIQMPLSETWQIGLGYELMGWGRSVLKKAPGQQGSPLTVSNINSQEFQLNLTFLIPW